MLYISSESNMINRAMGEDWGDRACDSFYSSNVFFYPVLVWLIQNNKVINETYGTANVGILVGVRLYSSIGFYWEDANFMHWDMWQIISEKK